MTVVFPSQIRSMSLCDASVRGFAGAFSRLQEDRLNSSGTLTHSCNYAPFLLTDSAHAGPYRVYCLAAYLFENESIHREMFVNWCRMFSFPGDLRGAILAICEDLRDNVVLDEDSITVILTLVSDAFTAGFFHNAAQLLDAIMTTIRNSEGISADEEDAFAQIDRFLIEKENSNEVTINSSTIEILREVLCTTNGSAVLKRLKRYLLDLLLALTGDSLVLAALTNNDCVKCACFELHSPNKPSMATVAHKYLVDSKDPVEALVGRLVSGSSLDAPEALEAFLSKLGGFNDYEAFMYLVASFHLADLFAPFFAVPGSNHPAANALFSRNRIAEIYIGELLTFNHVSKPLAADLALVYLRWSPLVNVRVVQRVIESLVLSPLDSAVSKAVADTPNDSTTCEIHRLLSILQCIRTDFLGDSCGMQSRLRERTVDIANGAKSVIAVFNYIDEMLEMNEVEATATSTNAFIRMGRFQEALNLVLGSLSDGKLKVAHRCLLLLVEAFECTLTSDNTSRVLRHDIFTQTGEALYRCDPQLVAAIRNCFYEIALPDNITDSTRSRQCQTAVEFLQFSVSMWRILVRGAGIVPQLGTSTNNYSEADTEIGDMCVSVAQGVSTILGSQFIFNELLGDNMDACCYIIECGIAALTHPSFLSFSSPPEILKLRLLVETAVADLLVTQKCHPASSKVKRLCGSLSQVYAPFF